MIKIIKKMEKDKKKLSDPKNIQFLDDIIKNSYCDWYLDNTFAVFKSYNDILYIIYTNNQNSIIAYNLIKKK